MLESLEAQIRKLRSLFWSERDQEGQAFVSLAESYRKAGDLEQAVELLDEGLGRHPEHTSGLLVLGRVHQDRGNTSQAEAVFRRVLELDAENLSAMRSLGLLAMDAGDKEQAASFFQRVLTIDPEDDEAANQLLSMETAVAESVEGMEDEEAFHSESDLDLAEEEAPDAVSEGVGVHAEAETYQWGSYQEEPEEGSSEIGMAEVPDATVEEDLQPKAAIEIEADSGPDNQTEKPIEEVGETSEEAEEVEEPIEEPEVYTRTMAEVYAAQGHYSRAIEILEHLHRARPEDEAIEARMAVLREKMGVTEVVSSGLEVDEEPELESELEPELESDLGAALDEGHLEALAEEMATGHPEDSVDSPFAWAEEEGQGSIPEASGPPIGDYFTELLGWQAPAREEVLTGVTAPYGDLPLVSILDLAPDVPSGDSDEDRGDVEDDFDAWLGGLDS